VPGAAVASPEGRKNTALLLGGGAVYSLLKKKTTAGLLLGAGGLYAYKRYKDARSERKARRAYASGYRVGTARTAGYRSSYGSGRRVVHYRNGRRSPRATAAQPRPTPRLVAAQLAPTPRLVAAHPPRAVDPSAAGSLGGPSVPVRATSGEPSLRAAGVVEDARPAPLSVPWMALVMGTLGGLLGALVAGPAAVVMKKLYQERYLTRRVRDPAVLEARSERGVADEGTDEAEARTESAPASASRRRSQAA